MDAEAISINRQGLISHTSGSIQLLKLIIFAFLIFSNAVAFAQKRVWVLYDADSPKDNIVVYEVHETRNACETAKSRLENIRGSFNASTSNAVATSPVQGMGSGNIRLNIRYACAEMCEVSGRIVDCATGRPVSIQTANQQSNRQPQSSNNQGDQRTFRSAQDARNQPFQELPASIGTAIGEGLANHFSHEEMAKRAAERERENLKRMQARAKFAVYENAIYNEVAKTEEMEKEFEAFQEVTKKVLSSRPSYFD